MNVDIDDELNDLAKTLDHGTVAVVAEGRIGELIGFAVAPAGRLEFELGASFSLAQADAPLARAVAGRGGAVALEI